MLDWTVAVGDHVEGGRHRRRDLDRQGRRRAAGARLGHDHRAARRRGRHRHRRAGDRSHVAAGGGAAGTAPAEPAAAAAAARRPRRRPQATSDAAKASPVARRAAAALEVDLGALAGSGPTGGSSRPTCSSAAERPAAARTGRGDDHVLQGGAAMLAQLHGREPRDPDGDDASARSSSTRSTAAAAS